MADRERIINEFKQVVDSFAPSDTSDAYFKELCCSVLELLKEQEPVMRSSRCGTNGISLVWTCGKCGADLEPNNRKARYCSFCGQAVKWDEQ
jgi:rubrerythrin